mgnify:CR=1 FL=1
MKKLAIFFLIIIAIVSTILYIYLNNTVINKNAQKENYKFEVYAKQEIYGSELTTLINKAIDYNEKNKDDELNIDIKFLDNDTTYNIIKIYNKGTNEFYSYYKDIKFKNTEIQYYKTNKKIKYMLFEQITQ